MKEITDLVQEFDPQINLSEVALYTILVWITEKSS